MFISTDGAGVLGPSGQDLQCVLGWFAAGMRISTSNSESAVLDWKKVACPTRGWVLALSGGV